MMWRAALSRGSWAAVIAIGLLSSAAAQTFRDGLSAYNVEDYRTALSIWERRARQGESVSQTALAYLYYEGKGVARDRRNAAQWYYLAATQDEPTAQAFLCEMHANGDGVRRDLELALLWCELSIENGETRGIYTREEVLDRLATPQRDAAWALIEKWRERRAGAGQHSW